MEKHLFPKNSLSPEIASSIIVLDFQNRKNQFFHKEFFSIFPPFRSFSPGHTPASPRTGAGEELWGKESE